MFQVLRLSRDLEQALNAKREITEGCKTEIILMKRQIEEEEVKRERQDEKKDGEVSITCRMAQLLRHETSCFEPPRIDFTRVQLPVFYHEVNKVV